MLHGSFLLFNPAYLGHARPLVQQCRQLIKLIESAGRVNLYPPVIFVSHPPAYSYIARVLLDVPAKSNPLHTTGNKPSSRVDLPGLQ